MDLYESAFKFNVSLLFRTVLYIFVCFFDTFASVERLFCIYFLCAGNMDEDDDWEELDLEVDSVCLGHFVMLVGHVGLR